MQTNQEFKVDKSWKVHTLLSKYDDELLRMEDNLLKPYEVRKKRALESLYAHAMERCLLDVDNRWLLLFNIVSAMRVRSKEEFSDTPTVIRVGKAKEDFSQFVSYIETEWKNTWVDFSSFGIDSVLRFTNTFKGKRTDNSMNITFNAIKDIEIIIRDWVNEIKVTLITDEICYQITFSGLNDIINQSIVQDELIIPKEFMEENDE
jgi:hypothetical protein